MAITVPHPAQNKPVSSLGVVRRLQALAVAGWTRARLAHELGISTSHLARVYAGRISFHRLALRVVSVFERLRVQEADSTPAARITRGRALARGWLGPDAWTNSAIDDPAGRPLTRRSRARVEDLEWMLATGECLAGACERLAIEPEALHRHLRRAERLDLWRRLAERGAA